MLATYFRRLFGPHPFSRLAQTHAVANAADACVVVSLAGSLFFNVSVDAARPQLTLYLLLTLTPFALVVPLVGPAVDRFSRAEPLVLAFTGQARAILAMFVAIDLKNLLLYPESFAILVLGKAYSVTKSAAVPGLVEPDELVAANSRLSRLGAIAGTVGGGAAAVLLGVGDPTWSLRLAAVLHLVGAGLALRIPRRAEVVSEPNGVSAPPAEAPRVVFRGWAMATLRAAVGFTTFIIAFGLKQESAPLLDFGAVALAAAFGHFTGTLVSPVVRRRWVREAAILVGSLFVGAAGLAVAGLVFGLAGQLAAAFVVGMVASSGKQAFDAALQQFAPEGSRGRLFARFETMFQLAWVAGALVPVVFHIGARTGILGLASMLAAVGTAATVKVVAERSPRPSPR